MARFRLRQFLMLGAVLALGACGASAAPPPAGLDPNKEPIVGHFSCYLQTKGDSYAAPAIEVDILPGRHYRTPQGEGGFTIDPSETLSIKSWDSGPFAGSGYGSVHLDDWGQTLSARVGPDADFKIYCFQKGPRLDVALIDFRLRDPQPGAFTCVSEGTNEPRPALAVLPGRTYDFGGAQGTYSVDIMSDITGESSYLSFESGPLADENAFYNQDANSGQRKFRVTTSPRQICVAAGTPTPRPVYGAAKSPAPPKGSGGLQGLYGSYSVDVLGYCGGLCWDFRYFTKDGYVYTRDPQTGTDDAACTKTRPNGLPVCQTYAVRNGKLSISGEPPKPFARVGDGLRIGNSKFRRLGALSGVQLNGKYVSFNYVQAAGAQGGTATQRTFRFSPNGRFEREGFVGSSIALTDSGTSVGTPVSGVVVSSTSTNTGSYRVSGNTLQLRYADSHTERLFIIAPEGRPKRGPITLLHIAGRDYLSK